MAEFGHKLANFSAWVTRPECLKGAKDKVKRPEGPPAKIWGPEGPYTSSLPVNSPPQDNRPTQANFVLGNPEGICIHKHVFIQVDIDIWCKWVGIQLVKEVSKMVQDPCERLTNLRDYGFPPHLLEISRSYQNVLRRKKPTINILCWLLGSRDIKSAQLFFFIAKSCFIIAHGCFWPHFNGIQWAFNLLNPAKNARNCVSSLAELAFLKWNYHCIRYRDILIEVESCSGKSGPNFDWDKTWNRLVLCVGCLDCPLFSKAKYFPILNKLCHFSSSLVPPNQFWMILPRNFDIGVHWSLSIWTFWWCHSWWRVDAHGWCTEGEWPDTKCGCKRKDVLAKYPAAREYSPWNIEQYSAQILINIRHIFWSQNVREIWKGTAWKMKGKFLIITISSATWPACGGKD